MIKIQAIILVVLFTMLAFQLFGYKTDSVFWVIFTSLCILGAILNRIDSKKDD